MCSIAVQQLVKEMSEQFNLIFKFLTLLVPYFSKLVLYSLNDPPTPLLSKFLKQFDLRSVVSRQPMQSGDL